VRRSLGWLYFYARRFDQARHHLMRAIDMSPTGVETHRVLGMLLADEGQFAEAERVLREALRLTEVNSYTMSTLGYALARAGRTAEAREILGELTERSRQGYVSPVAFATVHLGLGDRQLALDWIERARDDRRGWVAYLRVNPIFDSLRTEQRFEALAQSIGL
jgi:serine/threonine-protein kinase